MAYGSQARTVQESVAPYWKSVIAVSGEEVKPCRAIMAPANTGVLTDQDCTVTFADGSEAIINLGGGRVYPFAAIKVNVTGVIFLY
jgi:hypothetical protein